LDIVTIIFINIYYKEKHCIEYYGYRQTQSAANTLKSVDVTYDVT